MLILPLIAQDEPLGTLTLAAKEPGVFSDTVRRTLQRLVLRRSSGRVGLRVAAGAGHAENACGVSEVLDAPPGDEIVDVVCESQGLLKTRR